MYTYANLRRASSGRRATAVRPGRELLASSGRRATAARPGLALRASSGRRATAARRHVYILYFYIFNFPEFLYRYDTVIILFFCMQPTLFTSLLKF